MSVASVYPHYVTKAEKKGRTKAEVDEIIQWLTGYTPRRLQTQLDKGTDFETFFEKGLFGFEWGVSWRRCAAHYRLFSLMVSLR